MGDKPTFNTSFSKKTNINISNCQLFAMCSRLIIVNPQCAQAIFIDSHSFLMQTTNKLSTKSHCDSLVYVKKIIVFESIIFL